MAHTQDVTNIKPKKKKARRKALPPIVGSQAMTGFSIPPSTQDGLTQDQASGEPVVQLQTPRSVDDSNLQVTEAQIQEAIDKDNARRPRRPSEEAPLSTNPSVEAQVQRGLSGEANLQNIPGVARNRIEFEGRTGEAVEAFRARQRAALKEQFATDPKLKELADTQLETANSLRRASGIDFKAQQKTKDDKRRKENITASEERKERIANRRRALSAGAPGGGGGTIEDVLFARSRERRDAAKETRGNIGRLREKRFAEGLAERQLGIQELNTLGGSEAERVQQLKNQGLATAKRIEFGGEEPGEQGPPLTPEAIQFLQAEQKKAQDITKKLPVSEDPFINQARESLQADVDLILSELDVEDRGGIGPQAFPGTGDSLRRKQIQKTIKKSLAELEDLPFKDQQIIAKDILARMKKQGFSKSGFFGKFGQPGNRTVTEYIEALERIVATPKPTRNALK